MKLLLKFDFKINSNYHLEKSSHKNVQLCSWIRLHTVFKFIGMEGPSVVLRS